MATAPALQNRPPLQRHSIASLTAPLAQLDRRIRWYVFLEGMTWAVIFAGIWCLASFLFDYSFLFQWLGIDYLRDGLVAGHKVARILAWIFLIGGLATILFYHLIYRLTARFSPASLALVLERRFPNILGDRLITAIELSEASKPLPTELSQELLDVTVSEAENRIRQVSIQDVFNRKRLGLRSLGAGSLFVLGLIIMIFATDPGTRWAERNVFLQEAYWPRRTILYIADFSQQPTKAVPFGSELSIKISAWKWVVATDDDPEGWRPLHWLKDLMPAEGAVSQIRPWELQGTLFSPWCFAALPPEWQKLNLDQVFARIEPVEAFELYRREMGLAYIQYLQSQLASGAQLNTELKAFLPAAWQTRTASEWEASLRLAERWTPDECKRKRLLWQSSRPIPEDAAYLIAFMGQALPVPWIARATLQRIAHQQGTDLPMEVLSPSEAAQLPVAWRHRPIKQILASLEELESLASAEAFGDQMRIQLLQLFNELDHRADQSHSLRRRTFRRLLVPNKITIEFEQLLEGEDRGQIRAKRGQPEVKRIEGTMDFIYDFKKIEQPFRFRAITAEAATPWYQVDVKPLPNLKKLIRYHSEPGYLHESNQRVATGPFVMSLEGDESRAEAPMGTLVQLDGQSYKNLQTVRLISDQPLAQSPGTVTHQPGQSDFSISLRPLGKEDLRCRLELIDTDGIMAVRKLIITSANDRPAEFARAAFEVINRKMITPQAILPLSVTVRDDHGLMQLAYDVTLEKMDRTLLYHTRLPMRQFQPIQLAQPYRPPFRFERQNDPELSRLLASLPGDPIRTCSAMMQLPLTGAAGLWPKPYWQTVREYRAQYQDANLFGPVIKVTDEFLDTLAIRAALKKPMEQPLTNTPYRLVVRLVAMDNRRDESGDHSLPLHQESMSLEAFDFLVVNEQDLMIETGKREEDLRDRCEEVLAQLKKIKTQLQKMQTEFPTYSEQELKRVVADASDFQKSLNHHRLMLDEKVLREFRQVYRELALNRCQIKVLERIDEKICQPLAILLQPGNLFNQTEDAFDVFARQLEADKKNLSPALWSSTQFPLDQLIRRIEDIMNEMRRLIEFNQALQVLRDLIRAMDENVKAIEEWRKRKQKEELDP